MARAPEKNEKQDDLAAADPVVCGVMMPISRTANRTAEHWSSVQTLLHRCIANAGFLPVNAWYDTGNDRVSERIIGNIFKFPLFIADISDLNPNVMLELGLRLASKRPTIVVVNKGGDVPFDIRDFHYEEYPADLNILEMEAFFEKLDSALKDKFEASKKDDYKPFLSDVVIEVVTPQTENVSLGEAVMKQLGEISNRISRLENRKPMRSDGFKTATVVSESSLASDKYIFVNQSQIAEALDYITALGYDAERLTSSNGKGVVVLPDSIDPWVRKNLAKTLWQRYGNSGEDK